MLQLLASGSNAKGQLATLDFEDLHSFTPAHFLDPASPAAPAHTPEPRFAPKVLATGDLSGSWTVRKVVSGANHTLSLIYDGQTNECSIWGTGDNSKGQLPFLDPPLNRSAASTAPSELQSMFRRMKLPHLKDRKWIVQDVAASWETTFILLRPERAHNVNSKEGEDDMLLSMGSNEFGLLGMGGSIPPSNEFGLHQVDIRATLQEQIQLFEKESTCPRTRLEVRHLSAGPRNAFIVVAISTCPPSDNSTHIGSDPDLTFLLGWGASRQGQLQVHPLPSSNSPSLISSSSQATGDSSSSRPLANQSPNASTPSVINIFSTSLRSTVQKVSTGQTHSVLITSDHEIFSLGSNKKGQLDVAAVLQAIAQPHKLDNGQSEGFTEEGVDGVEVVDTGCTWNSSFVLARVAGEGHDVASMTGPSRRDLYLFSSGSNTHGQLGGFKVPRDLLSPGHALPSPNQRDLLQSHSLQKLLMTRLSTSRSNTDLDIEVESLVCGSEHVLLLVSTSPSSASPEVASGFALGDREQTLVGWGWNEHGNLGLGHTEDVLEGPVIVPLSTTGNTDLVTGDIEAKGTLSHRIEGVWAGCGTSWVAVRHPTQTS